MRPSKLTPVFSPLQLRHFFPHHAPYVSHAELEGQVPFDLAEKLLDARRGEIIYRESILEDYKDDL